MYIVRASLYCDQDCVPLGESHRAEMRGRQCIDLNFVPMQCLPFVSIRAVGICLVEYSLYALYILCSQYLQKLM